MSGSVLTLREAAEHLGRSTGFVRALIADGLVAGQQRRGRWYVVRESLDAWVWGGAKDPGPPAKLPVFPEVIRVRGRVV